MVIQNEAQAPRDESIFYTVVRGAMRVTGAYTGVTVAAIPAGLAAAVVVISSTSTDASERYIPLSVTKVLTVFGFYGALYMGGRVGDGVAQAVANRVLRDRRVLSQS